MLFQIWFQDKDDVIQRLLQQQGDCFPSFYSAMMMYTKTDKHLSLKLGLACESSFLVSKTYFPVLLCSQADGDPHRHVRQQHRPGECHQHGKNQSAQIYVQPASLIKARESRVLVSCSRALHQRKMFVILEDSGGTCPPLCSTATKMSASNSTSP